jgi:tetratricopeptide (TPR) repeat protein
VTGENERDDESPQSGTGEKPLTRGERIRREREAKAKAKVERRGREADQREERAIAVAEQARDATQEIMRDSGGKIALVLVGVLALLVSVSVVRDMMAGDREAKAEELTKADQIEAGAERAEALASIAKDNDDTLLGTWARLGEGSARLSEGNADAALSVYTELSATADLGTLERRLALEGLSAARVAKGDTKGAIEALERLAETDDADAKNAAQLGIARILASEGKRAEAKALVDGVQARLKEAGRRGRGFTYDEAEALASALEGG